MATQSAFPIMPSVSTATLLYRFDDYVYTGTPGTMLYKYVDAICGTSGVGSISNQLMLTRMGTNMETIYFNELDFIFGNIGILGRSPAESYTYSPLTDQLTATQWNEVKVKDAWYRQRIADFFTACSLGGTPEGIRMCVHAALSCDCTIYEIWRYIDDFGLTEDMGRSPVSARNEIVVQPHKSSLAPDEVRLVRDMLDRICPADTIVTVNTAGLAVISPVTVNSAAADSSYFEVQKIVTATPVMIQMPPPEFLPIPLSPTQTWLYDAIDNPTRAPYAAFNSTSEYSYYYLTAQPTSIDSVTYGTLNEDGSVTTVPNYQLFDTTGQYGPATAYATADSPDNYPGGKYGIHPDSAPALNPDGSTYIFPWASQAAFVTSEVIRILGLGGIAGTETYQLPVAPTSSTAQTFYPNYAIAYFPPAKESTISIGVTGQRNPTQVTLEVRDPANFVRSF
jgi:hypothetical protein